MDKKIVQCNGLSPDPSQVGISTIARNAKYLGLKQISDVIDSNTWNSYKIKSVQFFSNGETYKVAFELYTNAKQTIVVLHFHSVEKPFSRKSNMKIRSCKRSGLSQWTVYNTGMKRTALNNIPTFAITAEIRLLSFLIEHYQKQIDVRVHICGHMEMAGPILPIDLKENPLYTNEKVSTCFYFINCH